MVLLKREVFSRYLNYRVGNLDHILKVLKRVCTRFLDKGCVNREIPSKVIVKPEREHLIWLEVNIGKILDLSEGLIQAYDSLDLSVD